MGWLVISFLFFLRPQQQFWIASSANLGLQSSVVSFVLPRIMIVWLNRPFVRSPCQKKGLAPTLRKERNRKKRKRPFSLSLFLVLSLSLSMPSFLPSSSAILSKPSLQYRLTKNPSDILSQRKKPFWAKEKKVFFWVKHKERLFDRKEKNNTFCAKVKKVFLRENLFKGKIKNNSEASSFREIESAIEHMYVEPIDRQIRPWCEWIKNEQIFFLRIKYEQPLKNWRF